MNILVGYNGSNESKDALRLAQKHAKELGAKINVATAINRWDPLEYHQIQEAEQELDWGVKKILNEDNGLYETHLLINDLSPGDQLVQFAESHHVVEILLGSSVVDFSALQLAAIRGVYDTCTEVVALICATGERDSTLG